MVGSSQPQQPMKNLLHQDDPGNWPEPDNDYFNTCGVCEVTFKGPKRARICRTHYLEAQGRMAEATTAYEEAHSNKADQQYLGQSDLFVYRSGWTSGWIAAKYPQSTQ